MKKLSKLLVVGFAFVLTHGGISFAEDEISPEEAQRRKDVELFKMKDQSGETYYEQKTNIGIDVGYIGSLYDPTVGGGFGIQDGGVQVGLELNYELSPEFYLGGFGKWFSFSDTDTNYFPLGVQVSYYVAPIFYIGGKVGLAFSKYRGDLSTDFLMGFHLGVETRLAEPVSIAAEFDMPYFAGTPSFWGMGLIGKLKIWL